ncbi:hypothetical protein [Lonepinella sp. BR2271]|uniref:hypothetical protein n=1 Tax=Lonepinella sp. BR2271 TaxID=3434550 RepID=UPI003F6DFC1F
MKKFILLILFYLSTTSLAYANVGHALGQVVLAGIAIFVILSAIGVFKVSKIVVQKGVEKVREVTDNATSELQKVDDLLQYLYIEISPETGKVEQINFYLDQEYERHFYDIPANYVKRLKSKLEKDIQSRISSESNLYGFDYAMRHFYIGNQRILSWTKEIKN